MEHTLQALTPGTSHAWYRALYTEHRGAFVQWAARQYGVREEEARDAFQEAVIVLYR
ncbi:MAG: hypothetical protein IT231_09360, partial [Flavobacteriales bacterium]|nr:hypothetical protein [Flavobacteriales bacterium]